MKVKSLKIKENGELLIGGLICSIFLLWSLGWYFYSTFINGSIQSPFVPKMNMKYELVLPLQENFLLGTDVYGRSLFEVISSGVSYSILISLTVSFFASVIGLIIGYFSISGNNSIKRLFDFLTNFVFILPSLLLAILLMSFSGQSLFGLILVLVLTGWPSYAKLARGETKRIMGLCYLEGAKSMGASRLRIMLKVIFPEILPVFVVNIILGLSGVIISEATLGFLGLGGSEYSWGVLLSMGKDVLLEGPHIVIISSLVLGLLIIGLNFFGDGLRDFLDPKS
ncbi:MAG: hypothetical protein CME68_01280 [Halobacteriovoraceae bacterium]|nr:hypothetical protein [Halobacteriovoraceae bacterium]